MEVVRIAAPESPSVWLADRVTRHRVIDALAPITVALPSAGAALATRRTLARTGTVNVHCTILSRLAETLGAQRLASTGFSPLTPLLELAVARHLLAQPSAGVVRSTTPHRAMVETLAASLRHLRQRTLTTTQQDTLAARGEQPRTLIALLGEYEALLHDRRLYDARDLLAAAAGAVAGGASLRDVGPLIVHTPLTLPPGQVQLLEALAGRTGAVVSLLDEGPPEAVAMTDRLARTLGSPAASGRPMWRAVRAGASCRLVTAPSVTEEVRLAVRRVLADCEKGTALHRMAILHSEDRTYSEPLHDVLAAAGLPSTVIGGRPVSDSHAAHGLLGLLRLRSAEFSRVAVVTWLASFPRRHPGVPDSPVWDRLSRRAGVVCGVESWRTQLTKYAIRCRSEAVPSDGNERSDTRRAALTREAHEATAIATRVVDLNNATAPPSATTWAALARWAEQLLADHVVDHGWSAPEQEAAQVVAEIVAALPQADGLDAEPTVDVFIDTLERLCESRHRPEGRLGTGLVVGTVESAAGMAFDRVHVLGMTERAFPSRPVPDPFLPTLQAGDALDDREERVGAEALAFATVCAGVTEHGSLHLSTTTWDESDRPVYPSRWFVAEANALAGRRQTSARVREQQSNEWMEAVPSPLAGLLHAPAALNVAERRLRDAASRNGAGHPLRSSTLAARTDLPLLRALAIVQARRSTSLTAADGNLSDLDLDAELGLGAPEVALDSSRVQSATQLQEWATCPYRYFLNRLLHVESTDLPEDEDRWSLSALDKGTVVHRILELFFEELIASGGPQPSAPYTESERDRLHQIADEQFQRLEAEGLTGHPLVWSTAHAGIMADLDTFLERDAAERTSGDWRPRYVEQRFGYEQTDPHSWAPLMIGLATGSPIQLRGQIDRVDLAPSVGTATRARVIDYKTGRAAPSKKDLDEDAVRAGTSLQLALYARALQAAHPELTTTEAAYWFISTKGEFTLAAVDATPGVSQRLDDVLSTVGQGIAAGAFPQVPGVETLRPGYAGWDNCVYCDYKRICPTGRDSLYDRKLGDQASQYHAALAPQVEPEDDE
jgi:ATP-dependent helicase/nuclease subunit B